MEDKNVLIKICDLVNERKINPKDGSYTNYLLKEGLDKILKKVGEEASESIIAAKNTNNDELIYEISDLCYHLSVLLSYKGLSFQDVFNELEKRTFKENNLKEKNKKGEI